MKSQNQKMGKSELDNKSDDSKLEAKKEFSNSQSTSLGLPNFSPTVFGSFVRSEKFVGVPVKVSKIEPGKSEIENQEDDRKEEREDIFRPL